MRDVTELAVVRAVERILELEAIVALMKSGLSEKEAINHLKESHGD